MISIIDKFLQELKINGTAEKTLTDYSRFLKNMNKLKSLEKWDRTDVNRYIMEKHGECSTVTVENCRVKLKRFFTWAGKSELVSHLKTEMPANDLCRPDIMTVEDVNLLNYVTPSIPYKALIS
ncbi:MAG: site-specific integrase [Candidatus Methanoperedens sp.]|nr:site-specific integrase [Candidatus Methanoperedens sp.]MCZ7369768.1 site-specific integrase [Candidatus Methanoperedens sp.]